MELTKIKVLYIWSKNAGFLHRWLNEPHPGYEDSENPTKSTCPYCRQEITSIELLTTEKAANWDKYEGDALKEEKSLARKVMSFEERSEYKQYTMDVEAAKAALKAAEEEKEKKKIRTAKEALKAAEEKLTEEEKEKKKIRAASDTIQRELRNKRLIEKF